tara:strand:- start:215 stop:1981 length:1767 start_codon:yes stop_codon:yes gene_type:complete
MSKKITESMMKGLVERVLSEKVNLPFSDNIVKFRKDAGLETDDLESREFNRLKKIDGDREALSQKDLKISKAFNKPSGVVDKIKSKTNDDDLKSTIDSLDDSGFEFLQVLGPQDLKNADADGKTSAAVVLKNIEKLRTHWIQNNAKTPLQSYLANVIKDADTPLSLAAPVRRDATQDQIKAALQQVRDNKLEKFNAEFKSLIKTVNSLEAKPLQEPFGDLPSAASLSTQGGSLGDLNSFSEAALDSSYVDMLSALSGSDFAEKIQSLGSLAETLKSKDLISNLTPEQSFEIAATIPLLTTLFNLSKTFDPSAAGFEFEKFTAALLGGLQVGGANGATDVVAALKNNKVFRVSAKFLSSTELTQAIGGPEGIDATLEKGPLYYLFGYKRGYVRDTSPKGFTTSPEATKYNQISFYCIKISKEGDKYYGSLLSQSGDWFGLKKELPVKEVDSLDADGNKTGTIKKLKAWNYEFNKSPFARITALEELDSSAMSLANVINKNVEESSNSILKSLKSVFEKLENLKRSTQSFSAKKTVEPTEALSYVEQIGKDHKTVKDDYMKVFSDTEKAKFNSAVTESMLKKLIQEKFKK